MSEGVNTQVDQTVPIEKRTNFRWKVALLMWGAIAINILTGRICLLNV